jgi:hypothetical protein
MKISNTIRNKYLGKKFKSNTGFEYTIIDYNGASDVTIQFNIDDSIRYNIYMSSIKSGAVSHSANVINRGNDKKIRERIGEKHRNNDGFEATIVECIGAANCTLEFGNGGKIYNQQYTNILKGAFTNPFVALRTVYGIGYNTAEIEYPSTTEIYRCWSGMIQRCYSKLDVFSPAYDDCAVWNEWHNLQIFAKWHTENFVHNQEIDKDILFKGNRIYSPETCCFVPARINSLFTSVRKVRGDYPIGVSFYPNNGINKYVACINIDGKRESIGFFKTPEEAFNAYKFRKEAYIKELAKRHRNEIKPNVYEALMRYTVEITD